MAFFYTFSKKKTMSESVVHTLRRFSIVSLCLWLSLKANPVGIEMVRTVGPDTDFSFWQVHLKQIILNL